MRVGEVGLGLGVMDVLGRPKGSYLESFISIYFFCLSYKDVHGIPV